MTQLEGPVVTGIAQGLGYTVVDRLYGLMCQSGVALVQQLCFYRSPCSAGSPSAS